MGYSLSLKEIQDVCPEFTGQKINIEISVLSKAIKNIMGEAADSFLLKNKRVDECSKAGIYLERSKVLM